MIANGSFTLLFNNNDNNNNGYSNNSSLCQTSITTIVLPTVYVLMSIFGLPGNILSLWVFITKISDKTATHIYLINLAVSNLTLCLIMPLIAVYYSKATWIGMHHPICTLAVSFMTPIQHLNITLGMINLTWVAMSRCGTLIQNIHVDQPSRIIHVLPLTFLCWVCHTRISWAICLGTWVLLLGATLPAIVMYASTVNVEEAEQRCYSIAVENTQDSSMTTVIIGSVVIFFFCYLVVLVAYVSVMRHICHARSSTGTFKRQKIFNRVLRNILVIQAILTVCLMPHYLFKAIFLHMSKSQIASAATSALCHPLSTSVEVKNILLSLAALRCATDPITYIMLDRTFRKHARSLLRSNDESKTKPSPSSADPSRVHHLSQALTEITREH